MKKQELYSLLEHNKQEVPTGEVGKWNSSERSLVLRYLLCMQDRALDRLCDIMTFGSLEPCTECGGGQFVYQSGVGYRCQGDLSEVIRRAGVPFQCSAILSFQWTKCQVVSLEPKRRDFKVPGDFKQEYDFLAMYKSKLGTRIIPNLPGASPKVKPTNGANVGTGYVLMFCL